MKIIIAGCGRLGAALTLYLDNQGHDVTVIDSSRDAFGALNGNYVGKSVVGVAYDREVLEKAGIAHADAVIACCDNDEVNALVGRIAHNCYRVQQVIVRMFDPVRARIYRAMGLQTLSITRLGVDSIVALLEQGRLITVCMLGENGEARIAKAVLPAHLAGSTVKDISAHGDFEVAAISRKGKMLLPIPATVLESDDILYFSVLAESMDRLEQALFL